MPTAASASPNAIVLPIGISSPAPRRSRAKPTACRVRSPGTVRSVAASGTALHCGMDELAEPVRARSFLVFAVLQDRAECDVDRVLVDLGVSQRGERVRPVDRLGNTRWLVQLQLTQRFDCRRNLSGEVPRDIRRAHAQARA